MKRAIPALTLLAGLVAAAALTAAPDRTDPAAPADTRLVVGISPGSGLLRSADATLADDLDHITDLGATWIRIDIDWSVIEQREGVPDWRATDRIVAAAIERDLDVLGLLAYTPPWARPADTTDKHPPTDPDDFARFAAAAAERYRPRGIDTWEIWNEPNSGLFWEPGPDPTRYARLVERAAAAIESADPDATIVTGGLAPATDDLPDELSPEQFLRAMYRTLEPGTVDAVAIHPYSHPADPSDGSKPWNLFARLPAIHTLVRSAEDRPIELWLTEFGAPHDRQNPDRQAEILLDGLHCATQWPWIGPVFVYNLRDATEPADEPPFGLIGDDGRPRPAATALETFLRTPTGDAIDSACTPDDAAEAGDGAP